MWMLHSMQMKDQVLLLVSYEMKKEALLQGFVDSFPWWLTLPRLKQCQCEMI